jgi:hypothetical protein
VRSISLLRICTSTILLSGPITIVWILWYRFGLVCGYVVFEKALQRCPEVMYVSESE